MGAGTVGVAVLGWLLFIVVARLLGAASYAEFSVLWGLFFALAGLLLGLQQELTRSVSSARLLPEGQRRSRVLYASLIHGAILASLVLLSGPLWAPNVFGPGWPWITLAIAAGLCAYVFIITVNGSLAGRRAWRVYAGVITADAALRFALVVAVCLAGGHLIGWAWAVAGGSLAWLFFLPIRAVRSALRARGDVGTGVLVSRSAHAMVATGCSALLIAGFPLLLRVTSQGQLDARAGVILAAIIVTRSAVLLPMIAYQAVAITYFVEHRHELTSRLLRLLGLLAVGGALAAAGGVLVGPIVLRLLLGAQFQTSGPLVGQLVGAAVALAMLTLSGTALLAANKHGRAAVGWLVATLVTTIVLALPLSVETRCVLGLGLGPLVGLVVHLLALAHAKPMPPAA